MPPHGSQRHRERVNPTLLYYRGHGPVPMHRSLPRRPTTAHPTPAPGTPSRAVSDRHGVPKRRANPKERDRDATTDELRTRRQYRHLVFGSVTRLLHQPLQTQAVAIGFWFWVELGLGVVEGRHLWRGFEQGQQRSIRRFWQRQQRPIWPRTLDARAGVSAPLETGHPEPLARHSCRLD
jgi:hypothetical protein